MLSYRHAFHAGNFADVLKHIVLLEVLAYLTQKEKPFCVIDTHAGAGKYELDGEYALKNREFDSGIFQLWERSDLPDCVANYVAMQKRFNPQDKLTRYAGSPLLIKQMLRATDTLHLFELHSTEITTLTLNMKHDKRISVHHADGLKESIKRLPPVTRRGLVLIDPSYEIKSDYDHVVKTIASMHKRFATGTYMLWYPVIDRERNHALEKALIKTGIHNISLFELGIAPDEVQRGMTASGVIVINAPWPLANTLKTALPWLATALGQQKAGFYRLETLVPEM